MLCIRLLNQDNQSLLLAEAIGSLALGESISCAHLVDPASFKHIPTTPFAYWVSEQVRRLFGELPVIESSQRTARVGLQTGDDTRFIRLAWETPVEKFDAIHCQWLPFAKGGSYSPFYSDVHLRVHWRSSGRELDSFMGSVVRNPQFYKRPGLTWPRRTQSGLALRVMPAGCIFADKGPAIFNDLDDENALLSLLALTTSKAFRGLVELQMAFGSYECGVIQRTVVPGTTDHRLSAIARKGWTSKRSLEACNSTSQAFVTSPLTTLHRTLTEGISLAEAENSSKNKIIGEAQEEIDRIVYDLYGFCEEDRSTIGDMLAERSLKDGKQSDDEANEADGGTTDGAFIVLELINQLVGTTYGRFDIRFASGMRQSPRTPAPFEPLPACQPGILQNSDGLPAKPTDVSADYPLRISWSGILVVDEMHPEDIVSRVSEAIEVVWKDRHYAIELEACEILGVKTLRDYFRKPAGFFANHLSRHSKSRRQAPIYWQLSAGNGNYSAWLYYHRFTQDTLYRLLGDFVEIRIQEAEREQFELESQGGLTGDAANLLQEAHALLQDLRLFKSELELVAPLWNPNLNDGVIINHAILWRITPYNPWQKKCKECWDKLVKGDYDWAHLAFHLWPERVIRKCTTDRSLAIAHGLEERLWQETNNGNWLQRQLSEAELEALIAQYSKPAVQNALERFLAASPPVAAARTRAPRAARSSSTGTTRRPSGSAPEVDAETSRQTLLVLTAAPAEGLGRNAIAELLGVEAASLTAVIKQLKEGGQIEQLGAARGAKYRLTEQGRISLEPEQDA